MIKLSGDERKELLNAILDAYPDIVDLEMMVSMNLNENLNAITGGNNNTHIVFKLIEWAETKGCIKRLIEALYEDRTGNEKIKTIALAKHGIFPKKHWEELDLILSKMDYNLIAQVCRLTLENIANNQDVTGNYPDLINLGNLDKIKKILLEKCTHNDKGIPTIIEFAERLAKKVGEPTQNQLNVWVETVAEKLKIQLPTYSNTQSSGTAQSYLLITVTPKDYHKFYIEAELMPDYQVSNSKNKGIKIELNQEEVKVECSLVEIPDLIYKVIDITETQYLYKYKYTLTIELFLPMQYLGTSIDLEEIPIGFDDKRKPIGNEYRLVVRSLDRFGKQSIKYLNNLSIRWEKFRNFSIDEFKMNFEHFRDANQCNWDELATNLELQERLGLKITCGLPESDEEKKELFIAIIRGGVPIALWTRCNNFPDIEEEFDKLLTVKYLPDLSHLYESVWKLRKTAHAKQDKSQNYLGYHLGILCDNPNRVPFHLRLENQQLVETGL